MGVVFAGLQEYGPPLRVSQGGQDFCQKLEVLVFVIPKRHGPMHLFCGLATNPEIGRILFLAPWVSTVIPLGRHPGHGNNENPFLIERVIIRFERRDEKLIPLEDNIQDILFE